MSTPSTQERREQKPQYPYPPVVTSFSMLFEDERLPDQHASELWSLTSKEPALSRLTREDIFYLMATRDQILTLKLFTRQPEQIRFHDIIEAFQVEYWNHARVLRGEEGFERQMLSTVITVSRQEILQQQQESKARKWLFGLR